MKFGELNVGDKFFFEDEFFIKHSEYRACACDDNVLMGFSPMDEVQECESEDYDDSMDGDAESALASVGWGTDEDYGYYGA